MAKLNYKINKSIGNSIIFKQIEIEIPLFSEEEQKGELQEQYMKFLTFVKYMGIMLGVYICTFVCEYVDIVLCIEKL